MSQDNKFRFDELFDPSGEMRTAANKYLQDKDSSLLNVGLEGDPVTDTHEKDEYKSMSDELMRVFKMGWSNNMQLDGHALETIARIAQKLNNMSEIAESYEIDDILVKAGIKEDDQD